MPDFLHRLPQLFSSHIHNRQMCLLTRLINVWVCVSHQFLLWKRLNSPTAREWIGATHQTSSSPNHPTVSIHNDVTHLFSAYRRAYTACKYIVSIFDIWIKTGNKQKNTTSWYFESIFQPCRVLKFRRLSPFFWGL